MYKYYYNIKSVRAIAEGFVKIKNLNLSRYRDYVLVQFMWTK